MANSFKKDTLITFGGKTLELFFLLLVSIIIARVLGPEAKGIYSLAVLLPTLLITFTQIGVGPATVFYVGRGQHSLKKIFGAVIFFSILISIVATSIGLIIALFFGEKLFPGVAKEYLLLALFLIPFEIFLTFGIDILLGLQKIKKYNIVRLFQGFIFLFLISAFLLGLHFGIKAALFSQAISFLLASIFLFFQVKKETQGIIFSLDKNLLKDFFSYSFKVYFGNIATYLHLRVDMWMINFFLNPTAAGFYSISVALAEKIWLISQSAGTVLFPRISAQKDKKMLKKFTPIVCRNILFITFLMSLVLFLFGRWLIVLFYSPAFLKSVLPFQILLIGTVSISGMRILTNDLAGRGKPIINSYIALVSVILNIALNVLLIPKVGIIGAAWATAISYTFAFVIKFVIYARISGNKIRDVVFIKKSDFRFYKHFLIKIKKRKFTLGKD